MKQCKHLLMAAVLACVAAPAWSQSYLQDFTGSNAETFSPAPFGNVFGADIISAGRLNNGLYMMFNDSSQDNPSNFFLGGYFQRFGTTAATGLRNFTGMQMSVDISQIPVSGVTNPSPGAGFFAFSISFDANGDGIYNDNLDTTYRTNLTAFPYNLPGASPTAFNVALAESNFQFDAQFSGQSQFWDLTKVSRVGLLYLQNIPENGQQDFPNDSNLGWRFDNLRVDAIPEPGSLALFAVGLVGLTGLMLRRRK